MLAIHPLKLSAVHFFTKPIATRTIPYATSEEDAFLIPECKAGANCWYRLIGPATNVGQKSAKAKNSLRNLSGARPRRTSIR